MAYLLTCSTTNCNNNAARYEVCAIANADIVYEGKDYAINDADNYDANIYDDDDDEFVNDDEEEDDDNDIN